MSTAKRKLHPERVNEVVRKTAVKVRAGAKVSRKPSDAKLELNHDSEAMKTMTSARERDGRVRLTGLTKEQRLAIITGEK